VTTQLQLIIMMMIIMMMMMMMIIIIIIIIIIIKKPRCAVVQLEAQATHFPAHKTVRA